MVYFGHTWIREFRKEQRWIRARFGVRKNYSITDLIMTGGGVNKAPETHNPRNHFRYSGWIIYDACYLWPYTAGLWKHGLSCWHQNSHCSPPRGEHESCTHNSPLPPPAIPPLNKAEPGLRAASSLLFKQTGAYANPCFLSLPGLFPR